MCVSLLLSLFRVTPETESFTDTLRRSTASTHTNHGAHHIPTESFLPPPPVPDSFDRTGGGTGRVEEQGFGGSAHHHLSGGGNGDCDMSHDTSHFIRRQRSSSDEGSGGNGGAGGAGGFGRSGSMSSIAGANLHSPADESHHHADRLTHHNHSYVVRGSQRAGEVMDGGEDVRVELEYNNDDDDDDMLPVVDIDLRY